MYFFYSKQKESKMTKMASFYFNSEKNSSLTSYINKCSNFLKIKILTFLVLLIDGSTFVRQFRFTLLNNAIYHPLIDD